MSDEPFGRQPQKVIVTLDGELRDVEYWSRHLARAAGFKGDYVQRVRTDGSIFIIHPRAVND